jgi:hypothetical protein
MHSVLMCWCVAVQYNYGSLLNMGFRFFDAERVGALPPNFPVSWRGPALLQVRSLPCTT